MSTLVGFVAKILEGSTDVVRCGAVTLSVTPDKKLKVTGMPYGKAFPIAMKEDGLYIDGHLCKRCPALAERQC
jgi:hypothetical protein